MSGDMHALEEQLIREILVLQARLNEIPKSSDRKSRYVTSYLEHVVAHRSARLEAITSPGKSRD